MTAIWRSRSVDDDGATGCATAHGIVRTLHKSLGTKDATGQANSRTYMEHLGEPGTDDVARYPEFNGDRFEATRPSPIPRSTRRGSLRRTLQAAPSEKRGHCEPVTIVLGAKERQINKWSVAPQSPRGSDDAQFAAHSPTTVRNDGI